MHRFIYALIHSFHFISGPWPKKQKKTQKTQTQINTLTDTNQTNEL